MLEELLTYLNNWFVVCRYRGMITMKGDKLTAPTAFVNKWAQPGDYFRIRGSGSNDGFYQQPKTEEEATEEAESEFETFRVRGSGSNDGFYQQPKTEEEATEEAESEFETFRVRGSGSNDGFYQQPKTEEEATEEAESEFETFPALVEALLIPAQLVQLAKEMEEWRAKNGAASAGPYASESFGGYSYTRATKLDGSVWSVYDAFADRLAPYQRMNFARDGDAGGHAHRDPDYRRPFNTDFR